MSLAFSLPARNITGIRYSIDTHIIDREDAQLLRKLYETEWIQLLLPDTVMTEITSKKDPDRKDELLESSSSYFVNMGPTVLGSSLLNYSLNGSELDQSRIQEIHRILWNQSFEDDSSDSGSRNGRTRARDSLIVNNAIQYQTDALITEDTKLRKNCGKLERNYPGFRAISIEVSVRESLEAISAARAMKIPNLPAWPCDERIND